MPAASAVDVWIADPAVIDDLIGSGGDAAPQTERSDAAARAAKPVRVEPANSNAASHAGMSLAALAFVFAG